MREKPPSLRRRTTPCGTKKSFQGKKIFIPTQNSPLFWLKNKKVLGREKSTF